MKPYKQVCRCGHHITWHYCKKDACGIGIWYGIDREECSCQEYIPNDNLEYLEMKAYE